MTISTSPRIKTLSQIPCQYLKGVGPQLAKLLEKCQIFTVQDILLHLPIRYQDRTRLLPLRQARAGEWGVVEGEIVDWKMITRGGRSQQFLYELSDGSGSITLRFFHLHPTQKELYVPGARLRCFGEVRFGTGGLTLIHPECQLVKPGEILPVEDTLTPIYSSTEGMTQHLWRKIIGHALSQLSATTLPDYLPVEVVKQWQFMPLHVALQWVHKPPADADQNLLENRQHPAQLRLAFEELLAHHLSLRLRRQEIQQRAAPILHFDSSIQENFLAQLPFTLTGAQQRVTQEILQDMQKPHPMLRLVQGDVGSGKTVVAALGALQTVNNGYQAALMAPTEILADQHYQQFQRWFSPLNISVCVLNGQLTVSQRKRRLQEVATHHAHIIIGTHALFQKDVEFARLGCIIIDEQHRFGVEQRLALREKGFSPHQLIMTATPIPRTLAMTLYADLNLSIIDELPPGRTPIKTVLLAHQRREEIMQRIALACEQKRQVYWVCPLIEESEVLQCQAAETTAKNLQYQLPTLRIGLIHGRLKSAEKEQIMQAFKQHQLDILVATTVIEVGVDVPNASVMVIENAERLGLSQLHQLRGRVGRGSIESFCLLIYQTPLSSIAEQRLRVMREYQDGFKIAEEDLALRGPGELLGTRQTGLLALRVADLQRDQHLFPAIQQLAEVLMTHFPKQVNPLVERWVGDRTRFQTV